MTNGKANVDSVIVVGEQVSSPTARDEPPLSGDSGCRMARLAGLTLEEFLKIPRVNCWPWWDRRRIYSERSMIERRIRDEERVALLLGRKVAWEFGLRYHAFEPCDSWPFARYRLASHGGKFEYDAILVPHPSGRNRWYNSEANRERAARELRGLLCL